MVDASGTVGTTATSLLLLRLMALPEIISPFKVSPLVKDTDPLMSIRIPFSVPGLLSVIVSPFSTLKITFAGVKPPTKLMLSKVTLLVPVTLITKDWVAEPDKVKVVLFPRVIAVTFTTFWPGTVALIVVLVEIIPSVWFGVSPAR